jgi:uncharacterized protein YigE (DUF2233 family)
MRRTRPLGILFCLLAGGLLAWWLHLSHHPTPVTQPTFMPAHPQSAPAEPQPRHEAAPLPVTSGWVAAAPGADYCVREAGGGLARVAAVRVDLARYRVEVADLAHGGRTPQTVRALAAARGARLAINGGYFDDAWRPLGALVHTGKQSNPPFRGDGALFCVTQGRATLRTTHQGLPAGVTEALQCRPRLVEAGHALTRFKPGEAVRAAVGLTGPGELVLAVTCRGSLSLRDWARALEALGCADALNLDGGPSSQLYFHAGKTELDLPGSYGVPSALLVFQR